MVGPYVGVPVNAPQFWHFIAGVSILLVRLEQLWVLVAEKRDSVGSGAYARRLTCDTSHLGVGDSAGSGASHLGVGARSYSTSI